MTEEQIPQTSEAEYNEMLRPAFEEERWLFKVLAMKSQPSSALDDETDKQKKESESVGHDKSFLLPKDLQENKISSTDDNNTGQAACTEEDDGNSDSDPEDNVKVIIGDINTNPSVYMEMLTNLKSTTEQDMKIMASDNAMNPTE